MWLALVAAVSLTAPPLQGTIRVQLPSAQGASATEVEAVQSAVKGELEAEGYAVLTDEAKPASAIVTGSVIKLGGQYVVSLSISRVSDLLVLEAVKQKAKSPAELPAAGTEAAKQLASALRLSTGVRAKVKLK
ncbi:MAG: hypothetical protein GQE15_21275 [Archangiaceae bacterium]|nr:hypothetical protein [Archangiaceae bacterium]